MAQLLLIRHGQASYGQVDYDRLSPRGQEQARALGVHLATMKLDALFVGPLRRQVDTAGLAAEAAADAGVTLPTPTPLPELAEYPAFDLVTRFVPRLVELDPKFAALPTRPTRELADEAFHTILRRWSEDVWHTDGVERVTEFVDRVQRGLDRAIAAAGTGARIGCVTSAGPIGVAVGLTFGIAPSRMVRQSLVIRNASLTELVFRTKEFAWNPDRISLLTFNTIAHLPPELHTEY